MKHMKHMKHMKMNNMNNMKMNNMNNMKMNNMNNMKMNNMKSNPCTDKLTDLEYLEHMIPHHQVAIDMSNILIPTIKNPQILHLCRDIIRKQEYEIWEMTMMLKSLSETVFSDQEFSYDNYPTKLDIFEPILSRSKDGNCNPLFFKPNDHSKHMKHMKINVNSYLEHMIPHHQVAIDMSRRLLFHTNHSYLIDFCNKLIFEQQNEIFFMNTILTNKYIHTSELL
jgi:uncharacterized protein (DUF305 family)